MILTDSFSLFNISAKDEEDYMSTYATFVHGNVSSSEFETIFPNLILRLNPHVCYSNWCHVGALAHIGKDYDPDEFLTEGIQDQTGSHMNLVQISRVNVSILKHPSLIVDYNHDIEDQPVVVIRDKTLVATKRTSSQPKSIRFQVASTLSDILPFLVFILLIPLSSSIQCLQYSSIRKGACQKWKLNPNETIPSGFYKWNYDDKQDIITGCVKSSCYGTISTKYNRCTDSLTPCINFTFENEIEVKSNPLNDQKDYISKCEIQGNTLKCKGDIYQSFKREKIKQEYLKCENKKDYKTPSIIISTVSGTVSFIIFMACLIHICRVCYHKSKRIKHFKSKTYEDLKQLAMDEASSNPLLVNVINLTDQIHKLNPKESIAVMLKYLFNIKQISLNHEFWIMFFITGVQLILSCFVLFYFTPHLVSCHGCICTNGLGKCETGLSGIISFGSVDYGFEGWMESVKFKKAYILVINSSTYYKGLKCEKALWEKDWHIVYPKPSFGFYLFESSRPWSKPSDSEKSCTGHYNMEYAYVCEYSDIIAGYYVPSFEEKINMPESFPYDYYYTINSPINQFQYGCFITDDGKYLEINNGMGLGTNRAFMFTEDDHNEIYNELSLCYKGTDCTMESLKSWVMDKLNVNVLSPNLIINEQKKVFSLNQELDRMTEMTNPSKTSIDFTIKSDSGCSIVQPSSGTGRYYVIDETIVKFIPDETFYSYDKVFSKGFETLITNTMGFHFLDDCTAVYSVNSTEFGEPFSHCTGIDYAPIVPESINISDGQEWNNNETIAAGISILIILIIIICIISCIINVKKRKHD